MQDPSPDFKTTYAEGYYSNNIMINNNKNDLYTGIQVTNNNNKIFLNNFINITGLTTQKQALFGKIKFKIRTNWPEPYKKPLNVVFLAGVDRRRKKKYPQNGE